MLPTISIDSCLTGSAASVDDGIYFIRGHFVRVNKQTIILDQYNPDPSKRIGLRVVESTVSAKADETLYDNAKVSQTLQPLVQIDLKLS